MQNRWKNKMRALRLSLNSSKTKPYKIFEHLLEMHENPENVHR